MNGRTTQRTAMMLLVGMAAAVLGPLSSVAGTSGSARSFVEVRAREAVGIARAGDAKSADDGVLAHVDLRRLAERSMIDHWAALTESQRSRFVQLFSARLRRQLRESLGKRLTGHDVALRTGAAEASEEAGVLRVPVTARIDGRAVRLTYFVERAAGGWRLIDYEIDGALLSRNYRAQFNGVMRRVGFDGLIDRLANAGAQVARKGA